MNQQQINDRLSHIRSTFRFQYSGCIKLESVTNIIKVAVDDTYLYLLDSKVSKEGIYADISIKRFHKANETFVQDLQSEEFPPALALGVNQDRLLYAGYKNQDDVVILSASSKEGDTRELTPPFKDPGPFVIKSGKPGLFLSDTRRHLLRKYSHQGEPQAEIDTWQEGFEFPLTMEELDEENLFVSFGQERTGRYWWKKKKANQLKPNTFARWNHVQNRIFPLQCPLVEFQNALYSVRTDSGAYFISQGEYLIKLDPQFKLLFRVNTNYLLMDHVPGLTLPKQGKSFILGYRNGTLYLMDGGSASSVYSFVVD